MAIDISSTTRRAVYTGSGVGPYPFNFEVLAQTDIAVYKNDAELTLTTDYTVTVDADGTGSVTLVVAATGSDRITIIGDRTIQRTTDFTTGGPLFATSLNDEFDSQTIFVQQVLEQSDRALRAPNTDPTTIDMTLPINTVRANKTLAFDANGNPVIGEQIGDNRGNWSASTDYNKRDLVKDTSTNNIFMANTAHTSSGSQPLTTNTDSAKWDLIVDAESATNSAAAAATSATNAANSATSSATSATAASSYSVSAASSATAASTSATNAATSATNASTSESNASTSATNAATSETNALTSANSASSSASTATAQASAASTSATNAATSETNAATSATNAATSATNSATSASASSTSATNSANSATAAASAQSAAETARDQTLASFDSFDDRYLGTKTSDPTVDNDGDALVAGALYFNSTDGIMKVYTGSAWVAAYVSGTDFLTKAQNLADLTNVATARTNLGLGDAAVATIGTEVPSPTGTGASGTWAVNVSGYSGSVSTTNFSVEESGGKLLIKYGATTLLSIDSAGNLTGVANISAYGTP